MLSSSNLLDDHISRPAYPAATLLLNLKLNSYQHLTDRKSHPQIQICGNDFAKLNVLTNYLVLTFHEQEAHLALLKMWKLTLLNWQ